MINSNSSNMNSYNNNLTPYFFYSAINMNNDMIFKNNNLIFHKHPIVNNIINELFGYYQLSYFQNINDILDKIFSNNITFITNKDDYIFIYKTFSKLIKIRHIIQKYMRKMKMSTREWITTNDRDLSLNNLNDSKNKYKFFDHKNKTIQIFTLSEILNIFKFSILNSSDSYSFPTPHTPRNPYTNNTLSTKEMINMYNFLLNNYCKRNRCIPEFLVMFKNSYFDINLLSIRYKNQLSYYSAVYFIENLSLSDKFNTLYNFINSNSLLKAHSCIECIKSKNENLDKFSKVLALYELNTQGVYDFGDADLLFIDICRKNNLYFSRKHYLSHRRIIRGRRHHENRPNIVSNFEYSSPLPNLEVHNHEQNQLINSINVVNTDNRLLSFDNRLSENISNFIGNVVDDVVNNWGINDVD